MEAVSGEIEAQGSPAALKMEVNPIVRVVGVYVGAAAGFVPEPVHHGVLYLKGQKPVFPQAAGLLGNLHRHGEGGIQLFFPGMGGHLVVEGFQVGALEVFKPQHHPAGNPGPEAQPVGRLQGAGKLYPGAVNPQGGTSRLPYLSFQEIFHI